MAVIGNTNISTSVVGSALGISTHSVKELCTSANINMWSRRKPVHIANDPAPNRSTQWWRGTSYTCGITFTNAKVNTWQDLPSKYTDDGLNGWVYERPWGDRGGIVKSPYRLADFMGYNHAAIPPVHGLRVPSKVAYNGTMTANISFTASSTEGASLTFEDIGADGDGTLGDYYFGVVVTDNSGNLKGRVAGGQGIVGLIKYSCVGLTYGTYRVYPFLSQRSLGQSETDYVNVYYTLPNCTYETFTIVSPEEASGVSIGVNARYVTAAGGSERISVSYTIKITVEGGTQFKNNYLDLKFSTSGVNDGLMMGEQRDALETINATPDSPYTYSGKFTIESGYRDRNYYLYLTLDNMKYTKKVIILMPAD